MDPQSAAVLSAIGFGGSVLLWIIGSLLPVLPRRRARDAEWVPVGTFPLERNLVLAAMLTRKDAVGPILASLAVRGHVEIESPDEDCARVHRRSQPPDGFEREFFNVFFYDADVVEFRRSTAAEPRMAAFLRAQVAQLRARRYWGRGSIWPLVAHIGVPTLGLLGLAMAITALVLRDQAGGADPLTWVYPPRCSLEASTCCSCGGRSRRRWRTSRANVSCMPASRPSPRSSASSARSARGTSPVGGRMTASRTRSRARRCPIDSSRTC